MKNKRREKLLIVVLSAALPGMVLFTFARSSYFDKPNPAPSYMGRAKNEKYPVAKHRDAIERVFRQIEIQKEPALYHWAVTDNNGYCGDSKDNWLDMIHFTQVVSEYEGNSKWIDCKKVPRTMPPHILRDYEYHHRHGPSYEEIDAMYDYLKSASREITWENLTPESASDC